MNRGMAASKQQTMPKSSQVFPSVQTSILQRVCACGNHVLVSGECAKCSEKKGMLQRKLAIGASNDPLEREADRVADQVITMPLNSAVNITPPRIQRFSDLARKSSNIAPASINHVLASPGRPLEPLIRQDMEQRFNFDFSRVRVHTGIEAAQSARDVSAHAYTVDHHIVFDRGQYAPGTDSGRRLIAHELTHVVQQSGADQIHVGLSPVSPSNLAAVLQRACDPTLPPLSTRSDPVFFPLEATLVDVFHGVQTLTPSSTPKTAVGLVQQALVDLGYNLGTSGPHGDGVDRKFGSATTTGITSFQTAEAIAGATAGVLDQPTLKCLDDKRSQLVVPPHQAAVIAPADIRVSGEERGGRDEDIFFDRGGSILDAADKVKIGRLLTRAANPLKGCPITLEGFISEDELVEFGSGLATDRINAVDAEFVAQKHNDPGPACPHPTLPLRTHSPLSAVSSGVSAYRRRRKVEVVPVGATSTTAPCPPGSAQHRALTGPENTVLANAIDQAVVWMNAAIGELAPSDPEGDAALTTYFGGTSRRSAIKSNLITWRDHLDTVVRTNNRHGTQCNATCRTAIAFNQGIGASAQMTVCPPFFQTMSIHAALNQDEKKAFVMMHEAGHGSIGTRDTGYGHARLIEFLADFPAIAETNTDSYTLMVLCLNGFAGFCAAPTTTDTVVGLSGPEAIKSRRGLAWLQTWLTWTQQDTSSLYGRMNVARESGQGLKAISPYYAKVYETLVAAFNVRRPAGDPPPTFPEQTTVAAVLDRLIPMERAAAAGLTVEKDTNIPPVSWWMPGPGRHVFLADAYFLFTTDRQRVEHLLPLIIEANSQISSALEADYETYVKENVRKNRGNKP